MESCIFCKIVAGELEARKVYEDDTVLAFHDIQPQAKVHLLFIPKKHIPSVKDLAGDDFQLIADIHRAAQKVAKELNVEESGYRLLNNCGRDAGQVVFHIHYHLLAGEKLGPLNAPSRQA
jgi:histidine triad (HIT) family protein